MTKRLGMPNLQCANVWRLCNMPLPLFCAYRTVQKLHCKKIGKLFLYKEIGKEWMQSHKDYEKMRE